LTPCKLERTTWSCPTRTPPASRTESFKELRLAWSEVESYIRAGQETPRSLSRRVAALEAERVRRHLEAWS